MFFGKTTKCLFKAIRVYRLIVNIANQDALHLTRVLSGNFTIDLRVVFSRITDENKLTLWAAADNVFDDIYFVLL